MGLCSGRLSDLLPLTSSTGGRRWPLYRVTMPSGSDQGFDLRRLLEAGEAAPPVDVVDVLAAELAEMVDSTEVSLLIANFSGSAVVRLSHVRPGEPLRDGYNERAETLPLAG